MIARGIALWIGVVVATSPALADAAGGKKKPQQPAPAESTKRGKITVVRSIDGGEAQLAEAAGKRWILVGAARRELLRLSGHVVRVQGRPTNKKKLLMPTFVVASYVIVDAGGGARPQIGRLQKAGTRGYALQQDDRVLIVEAKASLRRRLHKRIGCKIWLAGDIERTTIRAYKFGWLSCKPTRPLKPRPQRATSGTTVPSTDKTGRKK